ncbi:phosphate ABC transporter substrate-binding protein [Rugamonas apoptosis]|uniref:Phosphate ABC transporter substrate-binding protein n=1 Tax=Rugamonas apoptosis TaxID=2758570 RepID=A0A7W2FEZ7_9BURK|nr:phosphate ABC transporter substrate-binding protein [Rugamonas apoptosis]MBA5690384.1 phosphate ABC transporter substrate-binding protein [Rugamonas apoptosis]
MHTPVPTVCRLLLAALLLAGATCRAEVVVIVSARNPVKALSGEQAADLFLGKSADFPNGLHAVPIDQSEGSPVRDAFYLKNSGKAPAQMKAHWARMLFTGRGQPPVESGDNAAIKRLVADNPNLVGYIDRSALDPSVRAVLSIH